VENENEYCALKVRYHWEELRTFSPRDMAWPGLSRRARPATLRVAMRAGRAGLTSASLQSGTGKRLASHLTDEDDDNSPI